MINYFLRIKVTLHSQALCASFSGQISAMFNSKLLTADPKEHLKRTKILLDQNDDSLLRYAALELRLAIERIVHNQLSLSEDTTKNNKGGNDPKKKKLIMNQIDPESDRDYDIYYTTPGTTDKIFFGTYKSIPESKVKSIEGRLGNLLHMATGIKLGVKDDPWYIETRAFLTETADYLTERITDSQFYFSFTDTDNFELVRR